jgi:hypothetical protein
MGGFFREVSAGVAEQAGQPGAHRLADRPLVGAERVVAPDDGDAPQRACGRDAEAITLALDNEGRDGDGIELG